MQKFFNIVLQDEQYHICIGNQKVTNDSFDTMEAANNYIKRKDWWLIAQVCALIAHNSLIVNNLINPNSNIKPEENEKSS